MSDKKQSPEPPKDDITIRCPRLGHPIYFSYCKSENNSLPCFKALDCWYPHFDVKTYFEKQLTKEEFTKLFVNPPRPKILSLVELIEKAKKRQEKSK